MAAEARCIPRGCRRTWRRQVQAVCGSSADAIKCTLCPCVCLCQYLPVHSQSLPIHLLLRELQSQLVAFLLIGNTQTITIKTGHQSDGGHWSPGQAKTTTAAKW